MDQRTFLKALVSGASQLMIAPHVDRPASVQDPTLFLDVRTLGARGDGRTDDWRALSTAGETAAAAGQWLVLPAGIYRVDRPLQWVNVPGVVGVPDRTVIRPTISSGTAVSIDTHMTEGGTPAPAFVTGVTVDGSSSHADVGVHLGTGALAGRLTLTDCGVRGFSSAGAVGLRIGSVVQGVLERLLITRNATNLLIEGPTADLPTTITLQDCNIREAVGTGLVVRGGYSLRFRSCIFESNGAEGALISPSAGRTALMCVFEDAWFENNARREPGAFQCDADGFSSATTCNPLLLRCLFTTERSRALRLRNATNFLVDSCRFPRVPGCVVVEGANGHGTFTHFQRFAGDFETLVAMAAEVKNVSHS